MFYRYKSINRKKAPAVNWSVEKKKSIHEVSNGWSFGVTVVLLDHSFYPNRNRTSSSRFCRFPLKYWMDKHFLLYDGMWDNLFIFIDVCAALIALTVWFQQIYFQSSCGIRIAIHWQYMARITVTWCYSLSVVVCAMLFRWNATKSFRWTRFIPNNYLSTTCNVVYSKRDKYYPIDL